MSSYASKANLFSCSKTGDPKQNVNSFMTPVSDSVFNALSHGSLGFAFHGSFFNHSLIGQNSSTANKNLCNGGW